MREFHARNAELNLVDARVADTRATHINAPNAGSRDREDNG